MFDSIVNDEVRYPRFLSLEAIAIMRRVSIFNFCLLCHFNPYLLSTYSAITVVKEESRQKIR